MQLVEALAVVQVTHGFTFTDWEEGTLNDTNCYTVLSDTCQVGVILMNFHSLSPVGTAFAQKLKSKTINAADAAQDAYLQAPNAV